jgi:hypothetical protein
MHTIAVKRLWRNLWICGPSATPNGYASFGLDASRDSPLAKFWNACNNYSFFCLNVIMLVKSTGDL